MVYYLHKNLSWGGAKIDNRFVYTGMEVHVLKGFPENVEYSLGNLYGNGGRFRRCLVLEMENLP